jgi:hypothetical protein
MSHFSVTPLAVLPLMLAVAGCGVGDDATRQLPPAPSRRLAELIVDRDDVDHVLSAPAAEGRLAVELVVPAGFVDRGMRLAIDAVGPAAGAEAAGELLGAPIGVAFENPLRRGNPHAPTYGEAFLVFHGVRAEVEALTLRTPASRLVALLDHPALGARFTRLADESLSLAPSVAEARLIVPLRAGGVVQLAVLQGSFVGRTEVPRAALTATVEKGACDQEPPRLGTGLSFASATATGITLRWGAAYDDTTAAEALEYRVVKASREAAIDTVAEASRVLEADVVLEWSAAATSAAVANVEGANELFYAVLVRDGSGNAALYPPTRSTDTAAPAVAEATLSAVTTSGMTVSWESASDELSPPTALAYKVVRSTARANIDTVLEVVNATGSMVGLDWTAGAGTVDLAGLVAGVTYYVTVAVRDEVGNVALYPIVDAATQAAADTTDPTPGSGVFLTALEADGMTATWGAASDDATATAALSYKVVFATSAAEIDTVDEVAARSGAGVALDWTDAATSVSLSGLTAGTTYHVAVLVRDGAGRSALYPLASATTSAR